MKPIVLIVDDDPVFAKDLMLLLDQDYDCKWANSIASAQRMLAQDHVSLILLDVHLTNGETGFDFLNGAKDLLKIPVVMISERPDVAVVVEAMRWGVFSFLPKNVETMELKETMQKALTESDKQ